MVKWEKKVYISFVHIFIKPKTTHCLCKYIYVCSKEHQGRCRKIPTKLLILDISGDCS